MTINSTPRGFFTPDSTGNYDTSENAAKLKGASQALKGFLSKIGVVAQKTTSPPVSNTSAISAPKDRSQVSPNSSANSKVAAATVQQPATPPKTEVSKNPQDVSPDNSNVAAATVQQPATPPKTEAPKDKYQQRLAFFYSKENIKNLEQIAGYNTVFATHPSELDDIHNEKSKFIKGQLDEVHHLRAELKNDTEISTTQKEESLKKLGDMAKILGDKITAEGTNFLKAKQELQSYL